MKFLNLDEIVPIKRTVFLKGVEYELHEQNLGEMIASMQKAKSNDLIGEDKVFERLLEQSQELLPSCPEDVLRQLTSKQLRALVDFAQQTDEEAIEEGDAKLVRETQQ